MVEKKVPSPKQFSVIFALLMLEGLGCLIALLLIPADAASAVLLGYSAARLAMAAAIAVGIAALAVVTVLVRRNRRLHAMLANALDTAAAFWLLLAGSLLGAALCINWPFAAAELQATYARAFPLLLFVTLGLLHLLVLALWPEKKAGQRKLALMAFGGILLISYLSATFHYSKVNREYWLSDQQAILSLTRQVKDSGYTATGTRDFMPGFPLLASPLMDTRLEDAALFAQGKAINIVLSLAFVASIFFLARRYFNIYQAALFTALAAFTLFIYKAPYYQPELTYYFFSFIAFVLMLELFRHPRFLTAIAIGLLLAMAQYTKASILPVLVLFCVAMIAQGIFLGFAKRRGWQTAGRHLAVVAVMLVAFLLPLSSYLVESKTTYGSYFYNVASTYSVWFDDWGEAKAADNQVFHFAEGKPAVPASELPSLQKYLREHDAGQILDRLGKGMVNQASNWLQSYAWVSFPALFLVALIVLAAQRWPEAMALFKEHLIPSIFLLAYFSGYTFLFAWYSPIADYADRRFTYGLFLPLMFVLFISLQSLSRKTIKGPHKSAKVNWLPAFYGTAAILLATDLLLHLPYQFLAFHWFGK